MVYFPLIGAASIALISAAAATATSDTPEAAVRTLIAGWYEGDAAKAASVLAADFRLATLRKSASGPSVEVQTRASLIAAMQSLHPHGWDVRLGRVRVQRDATGLATLWAPYTFYLDGRKSHCGIETFQLYRLQSGWKIINFADTHLWNGEDAQCEDRPR